MPWHKQFEPDEVLARAMQAFWAQGYAATSVGDLVARTGVNRASLYGTFGDKRALFLRALKRYDEEYRHQWFEDLATEHGPRGAIIAAFELAIQAASGPDYRGCLLVNTALELGGRDPELEALVDDAFQATEQFFRRMLCASKNAGQLRSDLDVPTVAGGLLGLFLGVRVLCRKRHLPTLAHIQNQVAALLD